MNAKRLVEVFSAGCPVCDDAIEMIKGMACENCEVIILDMQEPSVAARAKSIGIRSVPAIVINGKLTDCCAGRGPDEATLWGAGIGESLS